MKKSKILNSIISLLSVSLLLSGCAQIGLAHDSTFDSEFDNTPESSTNIYVSSGKVIFNHVDNELGEIYFDVIEQDETISLSFDGTTVISDRFEQPMSVAQLNMGDVVNIAYNSELNKVGAIVLSPDINEIQDVTRFSVSENKETFYIGDEAYSIGYNTKIYSANERIDLDRLIKEDNLTIYEQDRNILSIRVDDGHGYLELSNEEALVGGWIEVGQVFISKIMDGMLFTLPEGEYQVRLTNEGIDEYRDIHVVRNEVTKLDLSDIEAATPQKGVVSFRISPSTASTYVDGSLINTALKVRLPVGIHEITVTDTGYYTVSEYFEVTGIDQVVEVDLDLETANELISVSGNHVDRNLYAMLTVDNPYDVEIYEDNIYKGITPVSFKKNAGTRTYTFRKPGYKTVSYSVYIPDDGQDQSLSFPDLEREVEEHRSSVSGNSLDNRTNDSEKVSVSGNSISGNSVSQNSIN